MRTDFHIHIATPQNIITLTFFVGGWGFVIDV